MITSGEVSECAEESVLVLVGESPTWAKVSYQPNTKLHI